MRVNEDLLVQNLKAYYKHSMTILNSFGGPSIYFHIQAIKEQRSNFLSDRHIEMIYATLASWGMHRMGNQVKAKLVEFDEFKDSINSNAEALMILSGFSMHELGEEEYKEKLDELDDVYKKLKVSISDSTIVAHSKTLAHILPDLIPPIDRQYTALFFKYDHHDFCYTKGKRIGKLRTVSNLPDDKAEQLILFKEYALRMKQILDRCPPGLFALNPDTFNTSYPKIVDNLIMSFVKKTPNKVKPAKR